MQPQDVQQTGLKPLWHGDVLVPEQVRHVDMVVSKKTDCRTCLGLASLVRALGEGWNPTEGDIARKIGSGASELR